MLAAIIQTRMGSSRLPGKTLADLNGKPMLQWLIERVRASRHVREIIMATTIEPRDDVLVEFARARGFRIYRGSEMDVMDRFYQTAKLFGVDEIVRVTPDCPLTDPALIDAVVEAHLSGKYDYTSNVVRRTFPDGLEVEVFSFPALERAWREVTRASEREHVTPYLRLTDRFRVRSVERSENLSALKWSVDTDRDMAFMKAVYQRLAPQGQIFHWEDVLRLVREEPALAVINQDSTVNEGYYRSLLNDPPIEPRTHSLGSLIREEGARVWDVDGNESIDYSLALWPRVLGYNHPAVTAALERQPKEGLEIELAQQLSEIIPCAERVRFCKNDSDLISTAVRLARATTGREQLAYCNDSEWQDWRVETATQNLGMPFEYNNLESLRKIFRENPGQVAGVLMEPVGISEPQNRFLEEVRELARREGALLIFDERLTGFRLAVGGAQEYFGVTPDLACFGKTMANGLPLSALVGKREVMERLESVAPPAVFGGEVPSFAAALATVTELRRQPILRHLWAYGKRLQDGFNVLARRLQVERHARCVGLPPRTVICFSDETGRESLALKSLFQQECYKRGVLFAGCHNMCLGHGEAEINHTLHVYRDALQIVAQALREGQPVFQEP